MFADPAFPPGPNVLADFSAGDAPSITDDALRGQMERATPLGRIGDPADVAAAVVFLASPAGGYITGKIIEVDGGIDRPNLDLGIPDL